MTNKNIRLALGKDVDEIAEKVEKGNSNIGNIDSLATKIKTSLVAAINEIIGIVDDIKNRENDFSSFNEALSAKASIADLNAITEQLNALKTEVENQHYTKAETDNALSGLNNAIAAFRETLDNKLDKTAYASVSAAGAIKLKKNGSGANVSGIAVGTDGIASVHCDTNRGTYLDGAGRVGTSPASNEEIDARTQNYKPIVPSTLKYAVESITGKLDLLSTSSKASFTEAVNELAECTKDITFSKEVILKNAHGSRLCYHGTMSGFTSILENVYTNFGEAVFGEGFGSVSFAAESVFNLYISIYERDGVLYWDEYYNDAPHPENAVWIGSAQAEASGSDTIYSISYDEGDQENGTQVIETSMSIRNSISFLYNELMAMKSIS